MVEADLGVNATSRQVIRAMQADQPEAWIGNINRGPDLALVTDDNPLHTYRADFVLPRREPGVEQAIVAPRPSGRQKTPKRK